MKPLPSRRSCRGEDPGAPHTPQDVRTRSVSSSAVNGLAGRRRRGLGCVAARGAGRGKAERRTRELRNDARRWSGESGTADARGGSDGRTGGGENRLKRRDQKERDGGEHEGGGEHEDGQEHDAGEHDAETEKDGTGERAPEPATRDSGPAGEPRPATTSEARTENEPAAGAPPAGPPGQTPEDARGRPTTDQGEESHDPPPFFFPSRPGGQEASPKRRKGTGREKKKDGTEKASIRKNGAGHGNC